MATSTKIWNAVCSSCGDVTITQKSMPSYCKEQIRTGVRSIRRCGNELKEQQATAASAEPAIQLNRAQA